jgi:hypothetical protein
VVAFGPRAHFSENLVAIILGKQTWHIANVQDVIYILQEAFISDVSITEEEHCSFPF